MDLREQVSGILVSVTVGGALPLTKTQWPFVQTWGSDSGLPPPKNTTPDTSSTKRWCFLKIVLV